MIIEIAVRVIVVLLFLRLGMCGLENITAKNRSVSECFTGWFCIAASAAAIVMAIWPSH